MGIEWKMMDNPLLSIDFCQEIKWKIYHYHWFLDDSKLSTVIKQRYLRISMIPDYSQRRENINEARYYI